MMPTGLNARLGHTRLLAVALLGVSLILGLSASLAYGALEDIADLASPTHSVATDWYSDDSPEFTWDGYPPALGSAGVPGSAYDVAVRGNTAYVADVTDGLRIFDITEPATPTARGSLDDGGFANGVDVAGDTAYLAGTGFGLRAIDISDPDNPSTVDSIDTSGTPWDVTAAGHVAYVSAREGGVWTIDISEPGTLTALGSLDTTGTARGVEFAAGVAYVADGDAGLLTLDASEPGTLTAFGSLDTSGSANDVALSGMTAYVADGSAGLVAVDVSQPGTPTLLGSIDTSGSAYKVSVLGDLAYVADGSEGVTVIDVSDPSAMAILGTRETGDVAYATELVGGVCYVAGGWAGLETLTVSDPVGPVLLDVEPTSWAAYVDVEGDELYIADWYSMYMLDVSNPASMTPDYWFAAGASFTVDVKGNIAYLSNGYSGVRLLDVSDPLNPTQIGIYNSPGYVSRTDIAGNILYVADYTSGVHSVDVSDPAAPVLLDTFNTPGQGRDVFVDGNVLWVCDYQAGIRAFDISDPTNMVTLGTYNTSGNAYDIEIQGDIAYVADIGGGLLVFDVSDPTSITPIAQRAMNGSAWDLSVEGDQLLVADQAGLSVVDISDPTTLPITGSAASPGAAYSVDSDGDVAYISDTTGGVRSYQIADYTTGYSYSLDASAASVPDTATDGWEPQAIYPSTPDGEWFFHVRSIGRFGMAGPASHRMARIDTTEPTSTASAPMGWQSPSAPVSIEATDALSGVAATYYSLNGAPPMSYSGTLAISAEGTNTVEYYSVDNAGNREATQTVQVLVDSTPPVTTDDAAAEPSAPTTITLTPTDALSGVAETYWTLGSGIMTGTAVPVATPGTYTLQYWSVDHAGNIEATKSVDFTIDVEVVRRGGRDRYAVSVGASRENFDSADTVILATGWTYADALSASGLAGCLDAPILVTLQQRLPAEVEGEIVRLGATKVIIVGGPFSVAPSIEEYLRDDLGLDVERIGGADRYVVSTAIAARVQGYGYADGRLFIASGEVGADALSLSPVVFSARAPLVLTRKNVVPSSTRAALQASGASVTVLAGGPVTVTDNNLARMETSVGTPILRVWGNDRYSTAAAVARYGVAEAITTYEYVGVANGDDDKFADSLCGGPAVGTHGGVMTLTQMDVLPSSTRGVLTDAQSSAIQVQVFGGPKSVSEGVIDDIRTIIN